MALSQQEVGLKHGFRSGLEEKIAAVLRGRGVPFEFEAHKLAYQQPSKPRTYTPDFWLPHAQHVGKAPAPGLGIFVETKGRWLTEDRQKQKLVHEQHPDFDIRLLFSNAQTRISKQSTTTYALYCERNGWKYAHKELPLSWLRELGYAV